LNIFEVIVLSLLALTMIGFVVLMIVVQFVNCETIEKISRFFGWS